MSKLTSQIYFPEEKAENKTWLLFFCNPLIKETYVEVLETADKYKKAMKIQEFYYFHSRLTQKVPKNLINNQPKKGGKNQKNTQEFACYEVAVQKEEIQEVGKEPKLLSDPYKFHHNLVESCIAIQFEDQVDRFWLESNLGLDVFPMEFVKSSMDLTSLNRNNLFEWERTMPYTTDSDILPKYEESKNEKSHHLLILSFNTAKTIKFIISNSSMEEILKEDEEEVQDA